MTQNVAAKSLSDSGKLIASFNLAVKRNFRNDETDFFRVVVWENVAKNLESYTQKGDMIAVSGHLQNRAYKDDDGNDKYISEIVANVVQFLERKDKEG